MTTVIIDERTTKGKKLIEYLRTLSNEQFIKIEPKTAKIPNVKTAKAIQDAIEGKNLSKAYSNTDELFKDLKI